MDACNDWVLRNCRFAGFNAPNKNDRIVLPGQPNDYYLVESVNTGRDARGQSFWQASVIDKNQNKRMLHSDNVPSWSHYNGKNYGWHDEELRSKDLENQKRKQQALVANFEQNFKFPNGMPLSSPPGRPLMVKVNDDASGELALFAGERLYVKGIDPAAQTVTMSPVDKDLENDQALLEALKSVPAATVVAESAPAVSAAAAGEKFRLPNNNTVTSAEAMTMTPSLNEVAIKGGVRLYPQVYVNYVGRGGKGGLDIFLENLSDRIDPSEMEGHYALNMTPQKYDKAGNKENLFGAWSAYVVVAPPITPQMRAEAEALTIGSQISPARKPDGSFPQDVPMTVHSNNLFKNMLSLGVLPSPQKARNPSQHEMA